MNNKQAWRPLSNGSNDLTLNFEFSGEQFQAHPVVISANQICAFLGTIVEIPTYSKVRGSLVAQDSKPIPLEGTLAWIRRTTIHGEVITLLCVDLADQLELPGSIIATTWPWPEATAL